MLEYINSIKKNKLIKNFKKNNTFDLITECSGLDAISLIMKLIDIPHKHIIASEKDKNLRLSIELNSSPIYILDDVNKTKDTYKDYLKKNMNNLNKNKLIYLGGPPCPIFSSINNRIKLPVSIHNNNQGEVLKTVLNNIDYIEPDIFILENVKQLLNHDNGNTIKFIKNVLNEKFNLNMKILNTKNYGIPQNRERLYIVGINKKLDNNFNFPKPLNKVTPLEKLLFKNDTIPYNSLIKSKKLTKHKKDIIQLYKKNIKNKNCVNLLNLNISKKFVNNLSRNQCISPTLMKGSSKFYILYDKFRRNLIPEEVLLLQGYPIQKFNRTSLTDDQLYKAGGNSFSLNVIAYLLLEIIKLFEKNIINKR
jgi:DNA (cytosine-5)-methyltransferase 1